MDCFEHVGGVSETWELWYQVNIDFEKEPIGVGKDGKNVFLRDIWPSSEEVAEVTRGDNRLWS